MDKRRLIIIATSLILSFSVEVYADSPDLNVADKSIQDNQKYHSWVTAESILNFNKVLLMRSPVARKLKSSDDLTDKANYAEAEKIYQDASIAYHAGDTAQARSLALESISVIARSVSQYNNRGVQANR